MSRRRRTAARPDRSHVISPVVQRIAAEHGVDVSKVKGTGVGGRVRKKDLLAYIEAEGTRRLQSRLLHSESPYRPKSTDRGSRHRAVAPAGRREPLSAMRRQIAEHMLRSRRTAAHVTTVVEVDMSRVVERRAELQAGFEARGVPLTYLAFVARATVAALQERPRPERIARGRRDRLPRRRQPRHRGRARGRADRAGDPPGAATQPRGHRGSNRRPVGRARAKELSPEDVQGGTFTITNPGQFGTVLATPIINQPQVAILDLEAVVKRPVVVERSRMGTRSEYAID